MIHRIDIKLHHGGKFTDESYVGGVVEVIKKVDLDVISSIEVDKLVKSIGYDKVGGLRYRHPKLRAPYGIRPLMCDVDVRQLIDDVKGQSEVEVFVEHVVETCPVFVDEVVESDSDIEIVESVISKGSRGLAIVPVVGEEAVVSEKAVESEHPVESEKVVESERLVETEKVVEESEKVVEESEKPVEDEVHGTGTVNELGSVVDADIVVEEESSDVRLRQSKSKASEAARKGKHKAVDLDADVDEDSDFGDSSDETYEPEDEESDVSLNDTDYDEDWD